MPSTADFNPCVKHRWALAVFLHRLPSSAKAGRLAHRNPSIIPVKIV